MINNHFSTGNVYVVDDQKNEALPLIDSLFRYHIPHVYLDGTLGTLPEKPKQTRLIFLDLNLTRGLNPTDKKSFKATHAGILNRILANNSSSYIILVWSKEEKTYLNDFVEIFNDADNQYGLNQRPPLEIISLEKTDFFNSSSDENGIVDYSWKVGQEDKLLKLIENKLLNNEAFRILSSWENLISKSGSKVLDNLFDLVKGKNTTEINTKLNQIITSLSISFMGLDRFSIANNQEKTDAFMLALSELIDDEIDRTIIDEKQPEFISWSPPNKRLKDIDKAQLNTKLLTSIDTTQNEITGSVFLVDKNTHDYHKMLSDCFGQDRSQFKKSYEKAKTENTELTLTQYKNQLSSEFLSASNKIIPIEVNLTPLCDVVQSKQHYFRIVPGFIIDIKSSEYLLKDSDRNYFSPVLYGALEEQIIVLDYRYLISLKEISDKQKIFSLRKSFVDEIQLKLSNHVGRLGLLYLS